MAALCALAAFAQPASAQVVWNWSFGSEAGQFTTSGNAPGGVAAPGTYNLTDFAVTSSGSGATIGSMLGGQYIGSGFATTQPYDMDWSGSAVTNWSSAGGNSFNWWVFNEASKPNMYYFFGWESGNVNNPAQAAYYDNNAGCCSQPSAAVTVSVATTATPEPATLGLMGVGLAGLVGVRRRRRTV